MIFLRRLRPALGILALLLGSFGTAHAQLSELGTVLADSQEFVTDTLLRLTGNVEISSDEFTVLADTVDYDTSTGELEAAGNVVVIQPSQRVAADRVEFNVRTGLGTFHSARGLMDLGPTADTALFGSDDPAVMFNGEEIEILAPGSYRISNGAFTTCLQPTPRWELVSGTVVLNRNSHAMLRNTVLKVKNVPVFYLPILYYPMNDENRATGFLIPQYGVSTFRGQSLSNAFFWAIGRSQDATFLHDWYTNTGQGLGAEYRYRLGPATAGNSQFYFLNEHPITVENVSGTTTEVPGRRSYQIQGDLTHDLGAGFRAKGRVDYFSDITVQQTYNTNIYEASQRSRTFNGALTKDWGTNTLSGSFERSETFYGTSSSALTGTTPSVRFSRGEQPIGESRVYFSLSADYDTLLRERRRGNVLSDTGLNRLDVTPSIRFPFTTWPFLTVNSSVTWRNTYWTESLDPSGTQIPEFLARRYFDFQSQITGPVFNKIWDTPNSGYAERFKHSIEPFLNIRRTTAIDDFDRIVQLDSIDAVVGSTTKYTYGLRNRLFAKRVEGASSTPTAREILTVTVNQTYYTDAKAATYDEYYRSSFSGLPPSNFSPMSIEARFAPTLETFANFRTEYDLQYGAFRSMGADATVVHGGWLNLTAGWSQRRFIEDLPGYDDPSKLDHFVNQSTQVRSPSGRLSGSYTFNFDVRLRSILQQRLMVAYNAQCCGLVFEYQNFDFSRLGTRALVEQDRRFNFSFTLAGLGSFANFFGAMGPGQGL